MYNKNKWKKGFPLKEGKEYIEDHLYCSLLSMSFHQETTKGIWCTYVGVHAVTGMWYPQSEDMHVKSVVFRSECFKQV